MTVSETAPPAELAAFIDAYGRRVTAVPTRSGLLVILTSAVDEESRQGYRAVNQGHPALDREMAQVLGEALIGFADGEP
jgi:hypothetical protein